MKDRIELGGVRFADRDRFVARAVGTKFDMSASAQPGGTVIDLYDEISWWGIDAKSFRSLLAQASGDLTVRINSPGGSVTEGIAIYNDLLAYKGKKRVEISGIAASIASIIAMAGDEIAIADNAFFMIHNAWGVTIGDANDHRATADILAKMSDALARTYAANSKVGIRAIKEMMDAETWMTGKEAVEKGFATEILMPDGDSSAKALFDLSLFTNTPSALDVSDQDFDAPQTETDIEKLLMRDAGPRTRSQARALIKDIRAGKTSTTQTMPGAGEIRLDGILAALKAANEAFPRN